MATRLYLLAITVLLLVALALAVPVLVGIAREGLERSRQSGKTYPDEDGDIAPSTTSADDRTDTLVCSHCGAENSAEFSYCQDCAKQL